MNSSGSTDSLISWVGGKKALRETISQLAPDDIQSYIEPFGGGGWVLFYRPRWADVEVYNDINGSLVNLFRVAKYHPDALIDEMDLLPSSRELFTQFLDNRGLTCVQQAARFMYLIHRSFGSMQLHFGTSKTTAPKSMDTTMMKIHAVAKRINRVQIENKPYDQLISMYDHEKAFFFCDPPYFTGYDYGTKFDHQSLKDVLSKTHGRWILTYDDVPEAREMYKDYSIQGISRPKGINRKHGDMIYHEVIIKNY